MFREQYFLVSQRMRWTQSGKRETEGGELIKAKMKRFLVNSKVLLTTTSIFFKKEKKP